MREYNPIKTDNYFNERIKMIEEGAKIKVSLFNKLETINKINNDMSKTNVKTLFSGNFKFYLHGGSVVEKVLIEETIYNKYEKNINESRNFILNLDENTSTRKGYLVSEDESLDNYDQSFTCAVYELTNKDCEKLNQSFLEEGDILFITNPELMSRFMDIDTKVFYMIGRVEK